MNIVVLGLSITSSWGNGHATTYRGLVRGLVERGNNVLFLERNTTWYADNRDLPVPPYGTTELYESLSDLKNRFATAVRNADLVIVGSYVPQGVAVGEWVTATAKGLTAFYDIDTPVTLSKLDRGDTEYLSRSLVVRYDLYFSFTGGPTLEVLKNRYRAQHPRELYCSVDPRLYYPEKQDWRWDLGYLGTYSDDRQPALERLLIRPARDWGDGQFCVAGSLYPGLRWPQNVQRVDHIAPAGHRPFYNAQRFTLNVTRADMVRAGYSPSVRLFEAAACGIPIISDAWAGLESIFDIGKEILVASSSKEVLTILKDMPEAERVALGTRARARILAEHTCSKRAQQLEGYALELLGKSVETSSSAAV